jgi:excisionase family DNA binding protein
MPLLALNGGMSVAKFTHTTPRLSVTVPDAARATGFSENYVRVLSSRRVIPHVRVGRAVRLMVCDLEAFLRRHSRRRPVANNRRAVASGLWLRLNIAEVTVAVNEVERHER